MKKICSGFFNTLANKTRLHIIYFLREGEKSVNDIVEATGFEQSLVSHNLKLLKNCGFVSVEVRGKQRIYKLNEKTIIPILDMVDQHMETVCGREHADKCRLP